MHLQKENPFNSITILSFIRITMNELDPQISNTSEEQNPNSKIWTNFLQTFGPTLKWMKSHRIFLQAICVCFLFCLPGNIVTYVLHRRIQVPTVIHKIKVCSLLETLVLAFAKNKKVRKSKCFIMAKNSTL